MVSDSNFVNDPIFYGQSTYRGHVEQVALQKSQTKEQPESAAAIKIQSVYRGYLARLAVKKAKEKILSYSLFERAKYFIDVPEKLRNLPKASSGRTPVFLPVEIPVVLKLSGSPANKKRFEQMIKARELCDESKYSHLVIPKARIYEKFIIESRLPIMTDNWKKVQIGFYLDHLEQFTNAVEEFTGFLCQADLDDITGKRSPFSTFSTVPIGRYDNVAMYLDNGVGKIGLVDLEGFVPKSKYQKREAFLACRQAVRLFPHHFDVIINAAKKFDSNVETHREVLEKERDCIFEYFKKAYQNHLDFIKNNNIDITDPAKFNDISPLRRETIREAVQSWIQEENENEDDFENCLGENPDVTMKLFNEVAFPEILDATLIFIVDLIKNHIEYHGGISAISSYPTLLSARTLEFSYGSEMFENLKKRIELKLDMLTFNFKFQKSKFASDIIDAILQELEKGKEIAYYNPIFGRVGFPTHCIFC